MPTQQLITAILINQYPIIKQKPVINNNDASRIKKLVVTIFSDSYLYIGCNLRSVIFDLKKYKIFKKS